MPLSDSIAELQHLLASITCDLEKVKKGNKTAAQRVRTSTILLEKVALQFRKESMTSVKTGKLKKLKVKATPKKKKR